MIKTPIAVIGIDLGKNSFSMGGFPRVMDRLMKEMVLVCETIFPGLVQLSAPTRRKKVCCR